MTFFLANAAGAFEDTRVGAVRLRMTTKVSVLSQGKGLQAHPSSPQLKHFPSLPLPSGAVGHWRAICPASPQLHCVSVDRRTAY